ncbi:MAG: prepilin-type N-terminal cleavage/methylation domain-containing protein [candidate division Zixibacteria bacterium]|nr:prepilin-type N-terminal cleavage/methylation domain-containing protein [candidate division Zixibacteria bacterium]
MLYKNGGYTLIEVVMVIIVLGILASVSIPSFKNIPIQAKKSGCKSTLGGFRQAISIYNVDNIVTTGISLWPVLDTLSTVGAVMDHEIPQNPFQDKSNAPDSIVEGFTMGVVVGTRGGWAYKPSTGEIWPNTNTTIPGSGCGGPVNINENNW